MVALSAFYREGVLVTYQNVLRTVQVQDTTKTFRIHFCTQLVAVYKIFSCDLEHFQGTLRSPSPSSSSAVLKRVRFMVEMSHLFH